LKLTDKRDEIQIGFRNLGAKLCQNKDGTPKLNSMPTWCFDALNALMTGAS